jgi:NADH-quinone oxidoreductase subunit L
MAGPTPTSALIHAATMVTAGVYLIARTHVLFDLAPSVEALTAAIGALTLLIAGFSAMVQFDIKRVLAYSTISQIGYMFLALGVGAWSAAMFHFMTHAFFKALLFLGAGAVILAMHHEQNMFKMGGLRRKMPVTFWTFLIGTLSLAALPLIESGFYSKDLILFEAAASERGSLWLWAAGLTGALITGIYSFRMLFLTFFDRPAAPDAAAHASPPHEAADAHAAHGEDHGPRDPGPAMRIALIVLAFLSLVAGFVELPKTLANLTLFSDFMHSALPKTVLLETGLISELTSEIAAAIAALAGVAIAYWFVLRNPKPVDDLVRTPAGSALHRFWFVGWGFDWLYHNLFVRPFVWLARADKDDVVDLVYGAMAWLGRSLHRVLSRTETGQVRRYAMGIALGAAIVIALMVLL